MSLRVAVLVLAWALVSVARCQTLFWTANYRYRVVTTDLVGQWCEVPDFLFNSAPESLR